ncbi:hypothetical protein [Metabacillus fastidiosus]|uniref:hypothetical protein n=1 Tax=Metabacillus fastidiosus TaxID=1458 RepID=UPI003D2A8BB2
MAINKIENVQTTGDANGIDETDISTAITGINGVIVDSTNLGAYRIEIVSALNGDLDSATEIVDLVNKVNTMLTEVPGGITVTSSAYPGYTITIDDNSTIPVNAIKFVSTSNLNSSNISKTGIYQLMKGLGNNPTTSSTAEGSYSRSIGAKPQGNYDIVLIFLDVSGNVVGYYRTNNISIVTP